MVHVASLLLIFMKPCEVFDILSSLITSSQKLFSNKEEQKELRWHLTFNQTDYFALLSAFAKSYISTVRGQRSLLKYMNEINFDFNKYIDASFKSLTSHFVSLPIAIDVLMMYLVEGVRIIFRFTYAILKVHKR